jgi:transaldolase
MRSTDIKSKLYRNIHNFVRKEFSPHFDSREEEFKTQPIWSRLRELGSELWLDSGSIDDIQEVWTREFSALTTNNTLLNKEIQTGQYDTLIQEASRMLDEYGELSEKEKIIEIAFILNARHGLKLVEAFDAYVSVEEHTDLADDVETTVEYAQRYYEICPERFIVKIPFTPAGLLAARRLAGEDIPVNQTLGFSARQNYLAARVAYPSFVNVFLGRLNSFISDNQLGSGKYMGEKATLTSQAVIKQLRRQRLSSSRQIGASFRQAQQVRDLAGIDVMTLPPKVADDFTSTSPAPEDITNQTKSIFSPGVDPSVDRNALRLDTLWNVIVQLINCIENLQQENIDAFTPDDLIDFLEEHRCGDVLVRWTDSQIETSIREGKIPQIENWRDALESKSIGLDSLMKLAGLNSFASDQKVHPVNYYMRTNMTRQKKQTNYSV